MIKDQIRCPIDKNALQGITPYIRPELRIYGCLIKPANCHNENQRHKHMKKPVYIPAPKYGTPADRKTVVKVLLSLPEQIKELDKRCEDSQSHADPPEFQNSAPDPEICTLCIKAQPRDGEDAVEDE